MRKILDRIKNLKEKPITLERYFRQLLVLSRLRKLESILLNEKDMPFQYLVAEDGLYKAGKEEGREENMRDVIQKLLISGHMKIEEIAQTLNCSIDLILDVKNEKPNGN